MSRDNPRHLCGAVLMAFAIGAQCQTTGGDDAKTERQVTNTPVSSLARFGAYEDSYAIRNTMRNNGWAGKDEGALRFHYSLKYTLCGVKVVKAATSPAADAQEPGIGLCRRLGVPERVELFVAYTGEFDFYAGTRPSGPVINRLCMPGIYMRWPLGGSTTPVDALEIGVQHRSDGQVTEVLGADAERAQRAYDRLDRAYFDAISRGSDFVSVALDQQVDADIELLLRAKLKLYWQQDSAVTWGPLAGRGRRIADYDRLTLRGSAKWSRFTGELEWRVGDKGLATDSWTAGLQVDALSLPWYVRYHRGPMNTLSNYTQRQDSLGFGLRFARY